MGYSKMQVRLFSSGYCTGNRQHVFPGETSRKVKFHATWALIEHPVLGNILFDTGYSDRFFEVTKSLPERLYRWVTPVYHDNEDSCIEVLNSKGIDQSEIGIIVVSHFHADHIGGLKDFSKADIWCSGDALNYVLGQKSFGAVLKGILKNLVPGDIRLRAKFPEDELTGSSYSTLRGWKWHDDIHFIDLPGHARGQIGLLLFGTNLGDILLCSDAVWNVRSVHERIYPSRRVSLISDDYSKLCRTIDALYDFQSDNKGVNIIPSHCSGTLQYINS